MSLHSCCNEVLYLIAKELMPSQRDINALVQTCRFFFQLLNPFLYHYNVQYHEASALTWAVTQGIEATVQRSLRSGAPLQKKSSYTTPIREPRLDRIPGRIPTSINDFFRPEIREHVISRSARLGHLNIVRTLLENGVDPDYQNPAGCTPLSLAAEGGHLNLVHFLLANGASLLLKDFWGEDPLSSAAYEGHEEVTKVLLGHLESQPSGIKDQLHYALQSAVENGQNRIVEILLAKGVDVNCYLGKSLLTIAVSQRQLDMVKLLLESGADPNIVKSNEDSAFSAAAKIGELPLLQLLLHFGVDMDRCGGAALFWAVFKKHQDIVQYLITQDAPLRYRRQLRRRTMSTMDCAFLVEDQAIIQLLLKNEECEASDHVKYQPDEANVLRNEVLLSCLG